jgi:hypothetical protein
LPGLEFKSWYDDCKIGSEVNIMNDRNVATLTSMKYPHSKPAGVEATSQWKVSLMEKTWIALMVIALAVAVINTTAGNGLAGPDDEKADTPLKRVLAELVMK